MKKNKKKYYLTVVLVCVLIVLIFGILYYVNNSRNSYSFSEKSWINSNTNNRVDINIEGNLPVFSNNGVGVFYDFINEMEQDTKLSFNVLVNGEADYQFINKNEVDKNDLILYTDHFVLIGTNKNIISDLSQLSTQPIGVLSSDKDYVSKYLEQYRLNYKVYDDFSKIKEDMNKTIIYAFVPMYKYMSDILNNQYNIIYHVEGLHSHYVFDTKDRNSTLSNIFNKFYSKYRDEIRPKISKHLLNIYYDATNLSELEKESVIGEDLIIGFIDNMPYEGKINNKFSGITDEYLSLFATMTGATYKYIKYDSVDELTNALSNNKVDIILNHYNINNSNYETTVNLGNIKYVVVSNQKNSIAVDSIDSVKDDRIKMLNGTILNSFVKSKAIEPITYDTYEDLFKDLDTEDIIIMEKSTYDFYRNTSLKDYVIKFLGFTNNGNSFLINKQNSVLNRMFNFFLSTLGSYRVNNMAVNNSLNDSNINIILQFILRNITYILALALAVAFLLFKFQSKVKVTKKIKKEDKMLYLDVMTNLKNRNYLNDNLPYWESNKIYPQAVVVIDLNDIAIINDTKGHEEGDRQIKSAASILIKTQRENSEIIRSDGNEFLVYLVGYEEKQIVTYVNKLVKELKTLPYEYGASVGYSLIYSESITIDDAINEALSMMRKNKGE